jgi:hypothetical protein
MPGGDLDARNLVTIVDWGETDVLEDPGRRLRQLGEISLKRYSDYFPPTTIYAEITLEVLVYTTLQDHLHECYAQRRIARSISRRGSAQALSAPEFCSYARAVAFVRAHHT